MPSALKIKSGSSRFFDQEQVSPPPLGQRYGNNPTVSKSQGSIDFQLCCEEWHGGGRTHPFVFPSLSVFHQISVRLLSVSPSSPKCFQREAALSSQILCGTLQVNCFCHFSHPANYFKKHKRLILLGLVLCCWVFFFFNKKDNKASSLGTARAFS